MSQPGNLKLDFGGGGEASESSEISWRLISIVYRVLKILKNPEGEIDTLMQARS